MLPSVTRYDGYRSYSYLEEGRDYQAFELCPEMGREPPYAGLKLSGEQTDRLERILANNVIISLHDHPFVMPTHLPDVVPLIRTGRARTGFAGLARSGLTAVFDNFMDGLCTITSRNGWKWSDVLADVGMRLCDIAHQDFVVRAERVRDIVRAHERGQVALIPALEASTMIENELDRLEILYGFGIRQMGIAYSEANSLGCGLSERGDSGLTNFGRKAVERMNKIGIAIDVSHSGDATSMETIEHSTKPIFITHAGARAVWNTKRMKPDNVIRACADRGGVIGLEAAPHSTLSTAHRRHTLESVMDHFKYVVDLVGIEHVAFGPDTMWGDHVGLHRLLAAEVSLTNPQGEEPFEPVGYVAGLENPAECFWNIVGWLVQHDYSDDEISAVAGGNILRVLQQVWV